MKFRNRAELIIVLIVTAIPIFAMSILNLNVGRGFIVETLPWFFFSQYYFTNIFIADFSMYSNTISNTIVSVLITVFSQALIFFGNEAGMKYRRKRCLE